MRHAFWRGIKRGRYPTCLPPFPSEDCLSIFSTILTEVPLANQVNCTPYPTQKKKLLTMSTTTKTQNPVGPKKRLVICCDGTWQSANQGRRSNPSNIAKLSRAISQYFTEDEKAGVQICYYDAGVGTGLPGGLAGDIYKTYTGIFIFLF